MDTDEIQRRRQAYLTQVQTFAPTYYTGEWVAVRLWLDEVRSVDLSRRRPPMPYLNFKLKPGDVLDEYGFYDWHAGRCAACGPHRAQPDWWHVARRPLVADHDHRTGLLRGYLCQGCNVREGFGGTRPGWVAYRELPPAAVFGFAGWYGHPDPLEIDRYFDESGVGYYDRDANLTDAGLAAFSAAEADGAMPPLHAA